VWLICFRPSGADVFSALFPALTRWANECRRCAAGMSRKSLFRLSRNSAYEGRFTSHSLTVAVITAGNRAISRGRRFRSCRHSGLGLHSRIREHSWLPDPCWNSYACPASGQSSTPADVLGFARCNFGLPASLLITLLSCGGIRGSAVTRSPAVTPVLRWFVR
jgi:hypothetical protein